MWGPFSTPRSSSAGSMPATARAWTGSRRRARSGWSPRGCSYFFIGTVLTTAELVPDGPVADHCGTCTACLEACPTDAFVAPWVLDARRCLAYLTIEHRGDVPDAWKPHMRDWLFGCDVCQEVCPWNRKAPAAREAALAPSAPLPPLETLLAMDDATFRDRFRGTAMSRAKRAGLA